MSRLVMLIFKLTNCLGKLFRLHNILIDLKHTIFYHLIKNNLYKILLPLNTPILRLISINFSKILQVRIIRFVHIMLPVLYLTPQVEWYRGDITFKLFYLYIFGFSFTYVHLGYHIAGWWIGTICYREVIHDIFTVHNYDIVCQIADKS